MPTVVLPARQILRGKTARQAMDIMEAMPKGCAFRDGEEVTILRPVEMTFTEIDFKAVAGSAGSERSGQSGSRGTVPLQQATNPREQAT